MISSRIGAALALVLSVVAVALAVAAFMATIRDDSPTIGRVVQTRLTNDYTGAPAQFPVDDFFAGRDSAGVIRAYYVYPPGYFGHVRGCKIIWDPTAVVDGAGGRAGPGIFIDPCGGARFDRDGALVFGPADRGLDFFGTSAGVDGVIVDTRKLYCGEQLAVVATPGASDETPTETAVPRQLICDRVSPNTKRP